MPTRAIQCTYCGLCGEIQVYDLEAGVPASRVFKHLGHNPFSGHLHYQCPSCEIVQLVNPMDVLGEEPLKGAFFPASQHDYSGRQFGRLFIH